MTSPLPLSPEQLYRAFDPAPLPFETTADLPDGQEIIGQQRAIDAIRFGIGIRHQGYNLFALGPNGTGRQTTVNRFLQQRALAESAPDDWCYVYNFAEPYRPRALRLPPGRAVTLRDDMKKLVEELTSVLSGVFAGEEYQLQKHTLEEELRGLQMEALEKLREEAKSHSIALIQTSGGFAFAPLKEDGEIIGPDEFMQLDAEAQKAIETQVGALQEALQRIMEQMPKLQREMQARLRELNERVVGFSITPLLDELRQKYADLAAVGQHLDAAQADIVQNFEAFLQDEENAGRQLLGAALGIASPERRVSPSRYEVNVVTDNGQTSGAPVVFLDQPRYADLVGRVEHVAQMGALVTDFTLIKPGALHKANGGYLVIEALKLLTEPFAWEGLKRALRKREIIIESLGQVYSMISTVSLEPEPIPLEVKVVLIGERQLYYLLSSVTAAAGHAGVRKATASDAVAALERKTLVRKYSDASDGRAIALKATAKGNRVAQKWPSSFAPVIAGLSAAEQELLLGLVVKMIRQLQLRQLIAPQRTCVTCRHFRENSAPGTSTPHYCAFVGAPMAQRHLRVDCPEHQSAA